jgi:hypothetical protein
MRAQAVWQHNSSSHETLRFHQALSISWLQQGHEAMYRKFTGANSPRSRTNVTDRGRWIIRGREFLRQFECLMLQMVPLPGEMRVGVKILCRRDNGGESIALHKLLLDFTREIHPNRLLNRLRNRLATRN